MGAGFSGAVLARELAEKLDWTSVVIDSREHVAENWLRKYFSVKVADYFC